MCSYFMKKICFKNTIHCVLLLSILFTSFNIHAIPLNYGTIKNINGKFYSYIVLLFNENPHFVNLIQKDNIPLKVIGDEGFNIRAYKAYLKTIDNYWMKRLAKKMLNIYLEPSKYTYGELKKIEDALVRWNIVLKFKKNKNIGSEKITLIYCIYGKKNYIHIKHPILKLKKKIYNIQPFIYYDEFSTSSSTFYYDMIYIHPDEVKNDLIIASRVIRNMSVKSMFFVGSPVTDDIKYCLQKAFYRNKNIKREIWKLFIVHELTHKILNNQYNNFNQVTGEELSLTSTIYSNPYLGLSVLYSYLNYAAINPHRIAAMNFIKYISKKTGNDELIRKPSLLKYFSYLRIKKLAKEHFQLNINRLKK